MDRNCRTCLEVTSTTSIDLRKETDIIAKIELLIGIQISIHGKYPSNICAVCFGKINDFINFHHLVIETDLRIHQYINNASELQRDNKNISKLHLAEQQISCQGVHLNNPSNRTKFSNNKIERKYKCSQCNTEFSEEKYLLFHKNINLQCKNAESLSNSDTNDTSSNQMLVTYSPVHGDKIENILIETNENDDITQVGKHFETSGFNEPEMKIDHNEKMNQILLKDGFSENGIKKSINTHQNIVGASKKKYKCRDCDEVFVQWRDYLNHRKNIHLKRMCSVCGKVVRSDRWTKHMRIHQDDPISCRICNRVYKNTVSLQTHMYQHKGLKYEYECDICKRVFKCKKNFKYHIEVHKGIMMQTSCQVCEKNVNRNGMKKHMRTHTGERPHLCKFCSKGFTSSYALKVHVRQHTEEKPFICEYCNVGFHQKVSLVTHLKSKHDK